MKELVVVTHCDGGDEKHLAEETIPFAWRGQAFELDACSIHAVEFDAYMQQLVNVARKAKRGKRTAKPTTPVSSEPQPMRHRAADDKNKALRDKVRAHARKNGIEHAPTGMLKREAIDLWLVSHPDDAEALGVTS